MTGRLLDSYTISDILSFTGDGLHSSINKFAMEAEDYDFEDYINITPSKYRDLYMNTTKNIDVNHEIANGLVVSEPQKNVVLHVINDTENNVPVIIKDKKFIIGATYYICPFNNKRLRRYYTLKKFIYTINDELVRVVVMKQIKGNNPTTRYTLNQRDCRHFHIKYESGLEVFSMDLDWKLSKQTK